MRRRATAKTIQYVGTDPIKQGKAFDPTTINMIKAYNYYNYQYELKDARKWVAEYIKFATKVFTKKDQSSFSSVTTNKIPMWVCANSRMIMGGCRLPAGTAQETNNKIKELLATVVTKTEKVVQQSKENAVIADTEELFDKFYLGNYKYFEPNIYNTFKEKGIKQSDANTVHAYYAPLLNEIKTQKEGYEHLNTRQKKAYVTFIEKILEETKLYTTNTRKVNKTRKPRKKKLKSAEQLTSKVNFLTEDPALKLVSVPPSKIVGAQMVWLYNVKYKKLTMLVAETNSQLSVKGTTVIGFDTKKSKAKTIRKPEVNIPSLNKMTKVAMSKAFEKLKTKDQAATGRIGKDILIMKVY